MKAIMPLALMLVATALAGCGGNTADDASSTTGTPTFSATQGAITGLLINDVFRPIPGALVLLQEAGLTSTTDATGVFGFGELEPGRYTIKVQSEGHQAAARLVDVLANEYTEVEILADRLANPGSRIVTNQYSIFTPCAASAVVFSVVHGLCFYDESGDSYRPGISDLNYTGFENVTYLVAEVLLNQPDNYEFVIRHDDGSSFGGDEYGSVRITDGTYGKVIIKMNDSYLKETQPGNANWTNDKPLAALNFYVGTGGNELEGAGCTVNAEEPNTGTKSCRSFYGAGHKAAIEGNIIMSLFLGEPEEPIETYAVLA